MNQQVNKKISEIIPSVSILQNNPSRISTGGVIKAETHEYQHLRDPAD